MGDTVGVSVSVYGGAGIGLFVLSGVLRTLGSLS